MLSFFWNEYLFRPLFNILIYFYNDLAYQNLGLAVIYLTITLRFVLLPFSVISVWQEGSYQKLTGEAEKIVAAYKNDQVLQKQEIRDFLKKHRINPWSKAIVLGVQALALILLYQVFLGGIRGKKMDELYAWTERPDFVNTQFLGFDIGARHFIPPLLVALFLFLEISLDQKKRRFILLNADIVYKYFFPLFVFFALFILPTVKSLFILTSLIFSAIVVGGIERIFNKLSKKNIPLEEEEE